MVWLRSFLIFVSLVLFTNANPIVHGTYVRNIRKLKNGELKLYGYDEFPYMVRVEIKGKMKNSRGLIESKTRLCGGVIIDEYAVLTAGHCFSEYLESPTVELKAGVIDLQYESLFEQISTMDHFVIHRGFIDKESTTPQYIYRNIHDIALVWLKTPFKLGDKVKKAVLDTSKEFPSDNSVGWIVGWGSTTLDGKNFPDILRKAKVQVINREECQSANRRWILNKDEFCVLPENKRSGPSNGDEGGPFVLNGKVYGVMSFRLGSTENKFFEWDPAQPHRVTNVGSHIKWINEELKLFRFFQQLDQDLSNQRSNELNTSISVPSTSQNYQLKEYQNFESEGGPAKKPKRT